LLKLFSAFGQTMRCFRLHAFGFIMYLVLALLKVALVNFTLNEYTCMMTWWWACACSRSFQRLSMLVKWIRLNQLIWLLGAP